MAFQGVDIKFRNSRFIFGTKTEREVGSLECSGIRRDGKWLVLDAREGKFPGKNLVPKKRDWERRPLPHMSGPVQTTLSVVVKHFAI